MFRLLLTIRALVYAAIFLGAWGWLALELRAVDSVFGLTLPSWSPMSGVIVMTLGAAIVLVCIATFLVTGRGTQAPFEPPRDFVATGAYRWVRNPMYLGGFALLIGFGLLHRSPAILLLALGFLWFFHVFVVFYEEPRLMQRFGPAYEDYLTRVERWRPRRPRHESAGSRA